MNSIATLWVKTLVVTGFVVSGFLAPVAQASNGTFNVDRTFQKGRESHTTVSCSSSDLTTRTWKCRGTVTLQPKFGFKHKGTTHIYAYCHTPNNTFYKDRRPEGFTASSPQDVTCDNILKLGNDVERKLSCKNHMSGKRHKRSTDVVIRCRR